MWGDNDNRPEFIEWSDNRCPCGSPNFRCVRHRHGFNKLWCAYDYYRYVGGTRTEGYLVCEEFSAFVNAKIVIGCSRHTILGSSMLDGVLAMSRGPYSFIKQMSDQYGWMFSFCITSNLEMGYLKLGPESTIPSDPNILEMLDDDRVQRELYDVPLVSMVVGSEEIVNPGTFDGGCVLDTGTGVSRLVKDAFDAIVELMDAAFRPNGFTKKIRESGQVCYYPTEEWKEIQVPMIQLGFKGLSDTVVWMRWEEHQLFGWRNGAACLELLPSHDTWSTIGAFQMTDIHFTFDLEKNRIYFKESPSCGED